MKNNRSRWFDWFSAILLVSAFATVTIRMRVTEWTANMDVFEVLVIIGSVLGIMLGASRFSAMAAELFAINYTIFFVPWQLGLLMGKNIPWDERLLSLIGRLSFSINEVASNRPIQDSLLFLTSMSIFLWLLAIIAGYQLARHGRPWAPVLILGLTLAIVDFYTPYQVNRDRYSGIFVFLILLLAARLYLLRSKSEWLERGMAVDPEISYDLGRTVAISGLALVLLAWNVPTLVDALTPGTDLQIMLAKQWEGVRNHFQNAVAGLQNPVSVVSEYFGSELALGTGGAQGDDIVFTVQTMGGRPENVRFYWKARSFDFYDGTQWKTSPEKNTVVLSNEWPFRYPNLQAREEVVLNFSPNVTSLRNIYTPGYPLQISRNVDVLGNQSSDGTTDIVAVTANPALRGGEIFRVRSWVSSPTVFGLKSITNPTYPDDIKKMYLQLPPNFPKRITDLANEITQGMTDPYVKVTAITDWLRRNITYADTIDAAPPGRDIIDWFLFDYRKGYCNYYATSEVLMLRSLGIPARLAVGYAEGESEKNGDTFTVRRKDSHAWPEVYFPTYGWIEFEPTASQPSTVLPAGNDPNSQGANQPIVPDNSQGNISSEEPTPEGEVSSPTTTQNNVSVILLILIPAGIGLLIAVFLWLRRTHKLDFLVTPLPILVTNNLEERGLNPPAWLRNWSRHLELSPMQRMFVRVNWMLFLLGRKSELAQTPAERIFMLVQAEPRVKDPAYDFLEEYQSEEYSPHEADFEKASKAHRLMWRIVTVGALRRIFNFTGAKA